eukprot:5803124-Prymnesium_polylepis.1
MSRSDPLMTSSTILCPPCANIDVQYIAALPHIRRAACPAAAPCPQNPTSCEDHLVTRHSRIEEPALGWALHQEVVFGAGALRSLMHDQIGRAHGLRVAQRERIAHHA